jgi:hypothetical protein
MHGKVPIVAVRFRDRRRQTHTDVVPTTCAVSAFILRCASRDARQ